MEGGHAIFNGVLNLYYVSQVVTADEYDVYDGLVVAARNEQEVLAICRDAVGGGTWPDDSFVTVLQIGWAHSGIHNGVILGSFNAG